MKGYIYTMFAGADPGLGWKLNDPIFGKVPTLGACVPNIRRVVVPGDHIFVILQDLFSKEGEKVSDVIGRWRKLDERQIERLVGWIDTVRG